MQSTEGGHEVVVEGLAWLGPQALLVSSRVVEPPDDDGTPPEVPTPNTPSQSLWSKASILFKYHQTSIELLDMTSGIKNILVDKLSNCTLLSSRVRQSGCSGPLDDIAVSSQFTRPHGLLRASALVSGCEI